MKRSEINKIMAEADEFIQKFGFKLPPFAYWSVPQFQERKADAGEIIRSKCVGILPILVVGNLPIWVYFYLH